MQINTVKYDGNWEIMNIYENLLVYNSKVFLLFIVQSTDGQTNTLIGKTKSSTEKIHFIVPSTFP